jgi:hypothetical protein
MIAAIDPLQRRRLAGAARNGKAAARLERAARAEARKVGRLALHRIEPCPARLIHPRH